MIAEMNMQVRERECPAQEGGRDHVVEAINIGTAIVRFQIIRNGSAGPLRWPSCLSTRSDARQRGSTSAQNRSA